MKLLKIITPSKAAWLLVLLLSVPRPAAAAATNDNSLEAKTKKIFKYGTYEEQLDALAWYDSRKVSVKKDPALFENLGILFGQQENDQVTYKLLSVVYECRAEKYYPQLVKVAQKTGAKKDPLSPDAIALLGETLRLMRFISNLSYVGTIVSFFEDETKHRNSPRILSEAILGVGSIKPAGKRPALKEAYKKSDAEAVKSAVIQALAAYRRKEDIPFMERIIFSDVERPVHRWLAVVALKEYSPDPGALRVLEECYEMKDIDLKSRALYTLSFFKGQKMRPKIISAARSSSLKLRLQAVKALAAYNDAEVNELLMYKYKHDSVTVVKNTAREILEQRGLLDKE